MKLSKAYQKIQQIFHDNFLMNHLSGSTATVLIFQHHLNPSLQSILLKKIFYNFKHFQEMREKIYLELQRQLHWWLRNILKKFPKELQLLWNFLYSWLHTCVQNQHIPLLFPYFGFTWDLKWNHKRYVFNNWFY